MQPGRRHQHLLLIALVPLLLQLPHIAQYGYFRDELYYLASTRHLSAGYVDHPPLSILLLALVRAVGGDSLVAIRILPILCGPAMAILTGLMAREVGGGRFAQSLAALSVVVAPVYLGSQRFWSMNCLDQLLWTLAAFLFVRILSADRQRLWPWLGLTLGLGMLNKISVLWLGAALAAALAATPQRRLLLTKGPWIAAGIAAALAAPYALWQVAHDWPTLEFMANATGRKMVRTGLGGFLSGQLLVMNPLNALIWVSGLCWCLASKDAARWRPLAVAWLSAFAILAASGTSRPGYLAPAYPLLLAPGAVALERWLETGWRRWLRIPVAALPALMGLILAPLAIPMLPPDRFVAYSKALGITPPASERSELGELPQHYADMFGWEEMAEKAAAAWRGLPDEERRRTWFFGQNYGEAGALDVLGPRFGLPEGRVLSGHNAYWMWGAGDVPAGATLIVLGSNLEDNAEFFESVQQVDTIRCARCMPYERDLPVFVCRGPKRPLAEVWPMLKHFI